MDHRGPPKGVLPTLSVAETLRKADQFSLSDLHRQSNASAKKAILHELHSSMQLRAEKIRLHRKGPSGSPQGGGESVNRHESNARRGAAPERNGRHPSAAKKVMFHQVHEGGVDTGTLRAVKAQSRIPVPVRTGSTLGTGGQWDGKSADVGHRQTERVTSGQRDARSTTLHTERGLETYQYTWGLRGRLNELRIRYLARKFFLVWRKNTFLGVKPSVIRRHYNSRLLRKAFNEWREYWWTQRREWTLLIRAEYHHRYQVYQHVWIAWRSFVVTEKVKNAKKEIATLHAGQALLRKALASWKDHVHQRRAKASVVATALGFREGCVLKRHWGVWKAVLRQRRVQQDAESFAVQYWAETVTHKAWETWKRMFCERRETKQKEAYTQHLYEKTLLARCYYQGLVPYTLHRRERRQRNAHACQLYMDRLLLQAWQHWNQRWFTRRSLAQRQEQVDRLGNRVRMRRAVTHWRFYIHLLHTERLKEEKARAHHNMQLLKLGLLVLRLAVVQRRVKVRRNNQASEFHQDMLVKRCWNQWILQCEDRDELRMFSATRKARLTHRKRVLVAVMHQWCDYTAWRRHRKEQYARADVHYARCLIPKCIQGLRQNAELQKRKRDLAAQAGQFYRDGLRGRFFYRWWDGYQTSQDGRMMDRMAILHHEGIVAKRFFQDWRTRTRAKLKETEKLFLAIDHHHASLCTRLLRRWMEFTTESKQRCEFERLSAKHAYLQTARKTWAAWRQYVLYRRYKASKKTRADTHYQQRQMRRTFSAWKMYCTTMHGTYRAVAAKERLANQRRVRYAFTEWRRSTETAREERSLDHVAVLHWKRKLSIKIVSAWHRYAQQHAADAAIKSWRLQQLQAQLQRGKLQRAFQTWREFAVTSAEDRRKEGMAAAFHGRKLRARCLGNWRQYRLLCLKKALIARQASWLNRIRMQATFFSRWKHQFGEAQEENRQTVMALWLWSMRLQQHTLHAWVQYARERQRKKARIAGALELRRRELLKEGVKQWLMVAGSLGERRAVIAAKHHAQSSYKSYQIVHRCATLWRRKTLANREARKRQTNRRVRFEEQRPSIDQGSKVELAGMVQRSTAAPQPLSSSLVPAVSFSADSRVSLAAAGGLPYPTASRHVTGHVTGKVRPQPRRPDFLRDSLQREGLWSHPPLEVQSDRSVQPHDATLQRDIGPASLALSITHPSQSTSISPSTHCQSIMISGLTERNVPYETKDGFVPSASEGQLINITTPAIKPDIALRRDDQENIVETVLKHSHPSGATWTGPTSDNRPIPIPDTLQRNVPIDRKGETVTLRMRDNQENREAVSQRHAGGEQHPVVGKERRENLRSGISSKSAVLLPPSAFMSGNTRPLSDRGNMLRNTAPHPSTKATPPVADTRDEAPVMKRLAGEESKEDVYGEIQTLKNSLHGYQDMKSKLKKLRIQESELQGWLKELNLPSSVEDSAALLIGDELKQVQDEIESLSAEVRRSRPDIKRLLARITRLTQHASAVR